MTNNLQSLLTNFLRKGPQGAFSYLEEHNLDRLLGIQFDQFKIDNDVPEIAHQTSYRDFEHLFNWMMRNNYHSLLDLGAGYGRSLLLAESLFPTLQIYGVEIDEQRINQGRRLLSDKTKLIQNNIENCDLSTYQVFFLYFDYNEVVMDVLARLCFQRRGQRPLIVVQESHGTSLIFFRTFFGKQSIYQWTTEMPRHDQSIEIFELPELSNEFKLNDVLNFEICSSVLSNLLWASTTIDSVLEVEGECYFAHGLVINPFGRFSNEIFIPKINRTLLLKSFLVRRIEMDLEKKIFQMSNVRKYSLEQHWVEQSDGMRYSFQDLWRGAY